MSTVFTVIQHMENLKSKVFQELLPPTTHLPVLVGDRLLGLSFTLVYYLMMVRHQAVPTLLGLLGVLSGRKTSRESQLDCLNSKH